MLPPWNHLHPAIVHFPIALLTVAPLLVLLGLLWPAQRRGIHAAALVLLVLGFGGLMLALASGDAVERTPAPPRPSWPGCATTSSPRRRPP